jgi:hypothetical protein
MKTPTKTEQPKAVEACIAIAEIALQFRGDEKPNLSAIARVTSRASGLLRIKDTEEKLTVENAATVALAKKHNLLRTD